MDVGAHVRGRDLVIAAILLALAGVFVLAGVDGFAAGAALGIPAAVAASGRRGRCVTR